jgi:hypothetical protein
VLSGGGSEPEGGERRRTVVDEAAPTLIPGDADMACSQVHASSSQLMGACSRTVRACTAPHPHCRRLLPHYCTPARYQLPLVASKTQHMARVTEAQ